MQSKVTTVAAYLAALPADRRQALEAVRKVILANLDRDYEEGMQYGMVGYFVPHKIHPAGYHCDPSEPLPFAGLASQKNHMSLYLMSIYGPHGDGDWFRRAWQKTGKKLDMGSACIRFKQVEDLALDVIAEALKRMPAKRWIDMCSLQRNTVRKARPAKPAVKAATKPATAATASAKATAAAATEPVASKKPAAKTAKKPARQRA
jgi:hypothetical protein